MKKEKKSKYAKKYRNLIKKILRDEEDQEGEKQLKLKKNAGDAAL